MSPLRNTMLMHPRISPLQILLLIQLDASPKYGYEMLKSIKEAFEGVWELKTGTLYPALKSLEKRGLVETQNRDGVDFYLITIKGQKFLQLIGKHQERSMRFSTRFFMTLTKWMSPELKKNILSSLMLFANEDINLVEGIITSFLDESVDKETKLLVLKRFQVNFSKRLTELDTEIKKLETEPK
jgi:DNA-binding PadR family transcriptional regulator